MRPVLVGVLALATVLEGCATLTRGTNDRVPVLSDPPGATVSSSLGPTCTTPCSLDVARDASFSLSITKPGYARRDVAVTTRISGTGAALATENLATAGLGLAVDAATGATLEHVPGAVSVTLTPLAPTGAAERHAATPPLAPLA